MNRIPAYLFTPDREDEFEPPVTEREPACDDDTRRCPRRPRLRIPKATAFCCPGRRFNDDPHQ